MELQRKTTSELLTVGCDLGHPIRPTCSGALDLGSKKYSSIYFLLAKTGKKSYTLLFGV